MLRKLILIIGVLLISVPAFAVPVLQVGVQTDSGYVPYTTIGADTDTAFTSDNPFTLAVGGAFGPKVTYLGGSTTVGWSNVASSLSFLNAATGAVLMVTVPQGELGSITLSGLTQIATRLGSLDSGFPDNHYPLNKPNDFDFIYYDLETPFVNNTDGVVNFADPSDIGNGEMRFFDTTVSGYTYAHFDLLAIQYDPKKPLNKQYTIESSANSKDVSWPIPQPVPEPATMFLLGSGLIGLAGFARRKFKK